MTRKLMVLAAAAFLAGSPAEAVDRKDQWIADDAAAVVRGYSHYTIFDDITIGVRDGVVTLGGKVTMPFKRQDIERRVAEVQGVKEIQNKIDVLPASAWDDELRQGIARAIYGNSNFWSYAVMANPPIHIIVERGRVTLTGVVRSEVDRMLARSLALNFNALSVTNELKTDDEIREAMRKEGLERTD